MKDSVVAESRLDVANEPPADWDGRLDALGGDVHHTLGYVEFVKATQFLEPYESVDARYLTWTQAGRAVAMAAAFVKREVRGPLPISTVMLHDPPVTGPDVGDATGQIVSALREWVAGLKGVPVCVLDWAKETNEWPDSLIDRPKPLLKLIVDRADDREDVLRRMRPTTRHRARKAFDSGVTIREGSGPVDAEAFSHLHMETLVHLQKAGKFNASKFDRVAFVPALERLLRSGSGRLLLAEVDGDPVAGVVLLVDRSTAHYQMNGNSRKGREVGAVNALLQEALVLTFAEGRDRFNLGWVPPDHEDPDSLFHNLTMFKHGFGAHLEPAPGGTMVVDPRLEFVLRAVRKLRRTFG